MNAPHSDALVFFGATGDLAYKKIFPGAAGDGQARQPRRAGHRRGQGRLEPRPAQGPGARTASRSTAGSIRRPSTSCAACCATWTATTTTRPRSRPSARSWAPPSGRPITWPFRPVLFGTVVEQLAERGLRHQDARVIVEKPFGRDLASAQALNPILLEHLRRERRSSASTITSASGRCTTCCSSASPTPSWSRSGTATTSRACRSRWRRISASRAAARSTSSRHHPRRGPEPSVPGPGQPGDGAAGPDRQRIDPRREGEGAEGHPAARGQQPRARPVPRLPQGDGRGAGLEGRDLRGAAAGDRFLALAGVPFYIRAGKCLPVTCTEILVRLRRPPTMYRGLRPEAELLPLADQPRHHDRHRHQCRWRPARETVSASRPR